MYIKTQIFFDRDLVELVRMVVEEIHVAPHSMPMMNIVMMITTTLDATMMEVLAVLETIP